MIFVVDKSIPDIFGGDALLDLSMALRINEALQQFNRSLTIQFWRIVSEEVKGSKQSSLDVDETPVPRERGLGL